VLGLIPQSRFYGTIVDVCCLLLRPTFSALRIDGNLVPVEIFDTGLVPWHLPGLSPAVAFQQIRLVRADLPACRCRRLESGNGSCADLAPAKVFSEQAA
jgi:hypothetical protein